ncbi:methyltransferase domain-containing protein [Nocardioides sp.]|uniref:methyltransferase domain-containing protein n=1 Tax=Nocardioides sp. TaxID=35761 RepID=UPI0025CF93A1|nr:methyltransferase domain-containing protein [Nocardioides sp.]
MADIGGADVNGGYRPLFEDPRYRYQTVDLEDAEGVDVVLDDPYVLPYDDHSVDIVLSGQMLEHCEFFWQAFVEMMRVLKRNGLLILIAPSAGPIHQYPVDCYRYYPDGYRALAKYAGCQLLHLDHDERGPWRDLVGVFAWQPLWFNPEPAMIPAPQSSYDLAASPTGTEEEESISGAMRYLDTLAHMHQALEPALYLEIGVRHGRSLALANGPAVGVDPSPEVQVGLPDSTTIVETTSDGFFAEAGHETFTERLDLAFIDGMHLFEYALRDFMNIERRAHPATLVVVDDVLPCHPAQAERDRRTRVWTGDIWKFTEMLRAARPDLILVMLDTAPTGLLLIAGLDPDNRALWDQYNPLVRQWSGHHEPPAHVITRSSAISPDAPQVEDLLQALRHVRDAGLPAPAAQRVLREAVEARPE